MCVKACQKSPYSLYVVFMCLPLSPLLYKYYYILSLSFQILFILVIDLYSLSFTLLSTYMSIYKA